MLTLLILDDDLFALEALATRLVANFSCDMVRTYLEMREKLKERRYDAIILDLGLGGVNGITFLPELRELNLPVLIVSADSSESTIKICQSMGAAGYVVKGPEKQDIAFAISEIVAGRSYFPKEQNAPANSELNTILRGLTTRELTALPLVVRGLSYGAIGTLMGIEENSARNYGSSIIDKFEAGNRMELPFKTFSMGYFAVTEFSEEELERAKKSRKGGNKKKKRKPVED